MGGQHYQPERGPDIQANTLQLINRKCRSKELRKWVCDIICNENFRLIGYCKSELANYGLQAKSSSQPVFVGLSSEVFFFFHL